MKYILFLIVVIVLCTSCESKHTHELTYSLEATYMNGDKDTLSGTVKYEAESEDPAMGIVLDDSGCIEVRYVFFNIQRIACNVRSFELLTSYTKTSKIE